MYESWIKVTRRAEIISKNVSWQHGEPKVNESDLMKEHKHTCCIAHSRIPSSSALLKKRALSRSIEGFKCHLFPAFWASGYPSHHRRRLLTAHTINTWVGSSAHSQTLPIRWLPEAVFAEQAPGIKILPAEKQMKDESARGGVYCVMKGRNDNERLWRAALWREH